MARFDAHHRKDERRDPVHTWRRRVAYRLSLLVAVARALHAILSVDWPTAPLEVKAARLRARVVLERAWPLVVDIDGSAWE